MICSKNICAVIVSYNGLQLISKTIELIKKQVNEVLIVDNSSDELTKQYLSGLCCDKTTIIYNDKNLGVAFALNQGIKYASDHNYEWLLTLDQDSIPFENMVEELTKCATNYSQLGYVSFSPITVENYYDSKTIIDTRCQERYTVITSGNLVNLKVADKIGGFCDKLFIDSVDFEFCLKLKAHGYKILRCHSAILKHSLGTSESLTIFNRKVTFIVHSPFRKYYMIRNHIYITAKYVFKFPLYCMWKQVAIIRLLLQIIFLENHKLNSLYYIIKGLSDGICNNYGVLRK